MKNMLKAIILCMTFYLSSPGVYAQTEEGPGRPVDSRVTTYDRSQLFSRPDHEDHFGGRQGRWGRGPSIIIDDTHRMQTIDGFGFALTGGSAELMMKMDPSARRELIEELFGTGDGQIGVSYIRLTIGSSDLNSFVFSYDDLPEGETDPGLEHFGLARDLNDVVPVMKEILEVNPGVKILASPWSAPPWMKTNNRVKAGSLKKEYFPVYAQYFVKYIRAMEGQGIRIDAVTVQNEPLNSNNTPSMQMLPGDQKEFIRDHLGPAFEQEGIGTRIVLFDHNLDRIDYPLSILSDPEAARYVDGSGFHHYGGDLTAMSLMHTAYPEKNLYFTEQMVVERPGSGTIDIARQVKRLIIGATGNWSRNVILWNLAADPENDPHTDDGGCSMCQGAVTLDGNEVTRNLAYYTIAHASKFVRPGSVRIHSTQPGDPVVGLTRDEEQEDAVIMRVAVSEDPSILPNAAFRTPGGKIVLIVVNDSFDSRGFRIRYRGSTAGIRLAPGSVGTYVWDAD
jgi:glucosylceramidase